MKKKPVILFWDLETSLIVATTFSLYPDRLPHDGIIQDWFIVSGAWKKQGEKKVTAVSINDFKQAAPDDDYGVVKKLREVLDNVDILVHHNGDRFDMKKFTARLIYHNLPPLPKFQTIDTLKEIKKVAAFTSNRLDYLGHHLIGQGKSHTSPNLWMRVLRGDKEAVNEMVKYNKVDVVRLEQVYDRIRPYIKNHPHIGALKGEDKNHSCKACGSTELKKNGTRLTAAGIKRQEWQCTSCGSYSSYPILKLDGIN